MEVISAAVTSGNIATAQNELKKFEPVGLNKVRDQTGRNLLGQLAVTPALPPKDVDGMVKLLVERGVDINAPDFGTGRTPLHWAAVVGNEPFIRALLEHGQHQHEGVYLDVRDYSQRTPWQLGEQAGFIAQMAPLTAARMARAGNGPMSLAIIGTGAAGAALFIALYSQLSAAAGGRFPKLPSQVTVHLIDSKPVLGQGTPYSPELNSPTSLLNVAAAGMSINGANKGEFCDWIQMLFETGELEKELGPAAKLGLRPPTLDPYGFYPRTFFGKYATWSLSRAIEEARKIGMTVLVYPSAAIEEEAAKPDDKGHYRLKIQHDDGRAEAVDVTHIFYATGHFEETPQKPKNYETAKGTIAFPANVEKLAAAGLFNEHKDAKGPIDIAVFGSSLSAIDAIFSVLLHPSVGELRWDGVIPTYIPKRQPHPMRITCYSRKGLFSRVRPEFNTDWNLRRLSPRGVAHAMAMAGELTLERLFPFLTEELTKAYGKPVDLQAAMDPFAQPDFKGERDPFKLLASDVEGSSRGSRPWYEVMHALFPAVRTIYRQFNGEDREKFDRDYNSSFLAAFAPMPARSGRILLALHRAHVLDLFRTDPAKNNGEPEPTGDGGVAVHSLDGFNHPQTKPHPFLLLTSGLATKAYLDNSPLTRELMTNGKFVFQDAYVPVSNELLIVKPSSSVYMSENGAFEIVEEDGHHSPARRGVGFFLRNQLYDVQAVPSVVNYGNQIAELYISELIGRTQGAQALYPTQHQEVKHVPEPKAKL